MHQILLSSLRVAAVSLTASVSMMAIGSTAHAVEQSSDAHCFTRSAHTGDAALYPEDRYANGTMQDDNNVKAMEELTNRHWSLRLSGLPFEQDRVVFTNQFENGLNGKEIRYSIFDADASIFLEEARERFNRRTGSRYMYVTPSMKQLARDRSEIRSLKQKPCNKHILYLGG